MQTTRSSSSASPRAVIIVALVTAACLAGDSMLYIVLPTHWQQAGLDSLWEVGILLSINRLVRLPLTPFAGWFYAHINVRAGVLGAVVLTGILTAGYGLASNFATWVVLRCIWGVAWTLLKMGAYLMILDCADASCRGSLFGKYNGLFRLGSLVGMLLGGFMADVWGLAFAAFVFGGMAILAAPVTPRFVPAILVAPKETEPLLKRLKAASNPMVSRALITGLVIALAYQGVVASSLSHLIRTNFGSSVTVITFALGAASLAGIFQAMRWAWEPWIAPWFGQLSDGKMGRESVMCLSLIAGAVMLAILPFHLPIGIWLFLIVGMQITATALTTVGDAAAADAAAHQSRTTVMTLFVMAADIGAALGPLLGYFIAELWGAGSMYWGAAVLLGLTAAWWRFDKVNLK